MEKEKTGLVLEGGGVRGAYTAGALSWLAEQGIYFDYSVGISTGAAYLALHLSGETETAKAMSTGFAVDPENVGLKALLKCGYYVDGDRIFNHYLKEVQGFCAKPLRESDQYMEIGVYDLDEGKTVYYSNHDLDDDLDLMRAAISLPIASKPLIFKGRKLLDGGITKMIPIERALEQACSKCLVITTKPADFVRKPSSRFVELLMRFAFRKYPSVLADYKVRHLNYNDQVDLVDSLVASGRAIRVAPTSKIEVNRFKGDPEKCQEIYAMGYRDMQAKKEEIRAFLGI